MCSGKYFTMLCKCIYYKCETDKVIIQYQKFVSNKTSQIWSKTNLGLCVCPDQTIIPVSAAYCSESDQAGGAPDQKIGVDERIYTTSAGDKDKLDI